MPSNAPDGHDGYGFIRVTHRFHPQCGREFEFVDHRRNWGEDRVYFRDGQGVLGSLPAAWTDVVAEDPFVVMAAGRSPFRVDDLVRLAELVGRLRSQPVHRQV
jgi:uncharacterized protein DUF5372